MPFMLFFLLFANVTDAVCTDFGLRSGMITEQNPFMLYLFHHCKILFYLVKISLPLVLLAILKSKRAYSRFLTGLLTGAVVIYAGVLIVHVWWVVEWTISR